MLLELPLRDKQYFELNWILNTDVTETVNKKLSVIIFFFIYLLTIIILIYKKNELVYIYSDTQRKL